MISVILVTCDKYQPYWGAFYHLFFKHSTIDWNAVYHVSETLTPETLKCVIPLLTNKPRKPEYWSEGLLEAVKQVDDDFFILLLEDFFFTGKIDKNILEQHYDFMKQHPEIGCLRLVPVPGGDTLYTHNDYKEHSTKQLYRISTQPAIWRKEYFLNLLKVGENPWEFEKNASLRSHSIDGKVIVTNKPPYCMSYFNSVIQGKLTLNGLRYLKKNNVRFELSQVSVNTSVEEFYWNTKNMFLRKVIDFINFRLFPIKKINFHKI